MFSLLLKKKITKYYDSLSFIQLDDKEEAWENYKYKVDELFKSRRRRLLGKIIDVDRFIKLTTYMRKTLDPRYYYNSLSPELQSICKLIVKKNNNLERYYFTCCHGKTSLLFYDENNFHDKVYIYDVVEYIKGTKDLV